MIRKAPPLEAVEIFVAAAQGRSFRSVAHDLALSPSAVSRRIASLESFLGVQLFVRSRQHTFLTPAGQAYLEAVGPSLMAICSAGAAVSAQPEQPLRVAVSHSFATWLMPHLPTFLAMTGVEVDLIPCRDADILRSGEADLAIWGGLTCPSDLHEEPLFEVKVVPVVAPLLRPSPTTGPFASCLTLVNVRHPNGLWDDWFAVTGARPVTTPTYRYFDTLQLMYEAASAGMGVALAMPLLSDPYIDCGRLVPLAERTRTLGFRYGLFGLPRGCTGSAAQCFRSWIRELVEDASAKFDRRISTESSQVEATLISDQLDRTRSKLIG